MGLTKIEADVFRGAKASLDRSAYSMLNPSAKPGSIVFSGSCAARFSIASQVACKLSLEHFTESVLSYFELNKLDPAPPEKAELSAEILEEAFRMANRNVYRFGHSLAAGGTMSATLIGLVIEDSMAAAGRAGGGSAFLLRQGEIFPFFESEDEIDTDSRNDSFIGERSIITVDLASVELEQDDQILLTHRTLEDRELTLLEEQMSSLLLKSGQRPVSSELLATTLFADLGELPFILTLKIGPEAVYLDHAQEVSP